jgi:pilus assembly protein CpaF
MICASIDVIIQAARLRDGSRRITHVTEVMGMEGDTIITQDLFVFDLIGEDANGQIVGRHRSTGIGRPRFWIARDTTARKSGLPPRSTPRR